VSLFEHPPYALQKEEKSHFLLDHLTPLHTHHLEHSKEFYNIAKSFDALNPKSLEEFFPLPVRIFKEMELKSTEEVFKTMTSSGTTSTKLSKIFLDTHTAKLQTKALVYIMQEFLGKQRLPMLLVESQSIVKNRTKFSARAAGVLGLSNFGRHHTYILDDDMQLKTDTLLEFLERFKGERVLIFGFTFMVWQYFFKALKKQNLQIDLSNAVLFHSGGWKKLVNEAVSNEVFKSSFKELTGLERIHNFYGMVEQVGSIFVECEAGYLHTPNFADVLFRDPLTHKPLGIGETGLIELVSLLPHSYPGHVILSEDLGILRGEDDCECGRKGRYFEVFGRLKQAETRGCSDTFTKEKH